MSTSWTKDHPRRLRHTSGYLHRGVSREACLRTDPPWCDWHQLYARGQWEWAGRGKKKSSQTPAFSFLGVTAAVVRILWSAVPFHHQLMSLELRAITKAFVFNLSKSGNCYSLKKVIKKANKYRDKTSNIIYCYKTINTVMKPRWKTQTLCE